MTEKAYLGIGSNIGDRLQNLRQAVVELKRAGVKVTRASSVYETEPWGSIDQPKFLNAVIEVESDLVPRRLLQALKALEAALGRTEARRWGPRLIDIDILIYDNLSVDEEDLHIPHQHLCHRLFVLAPLADLIPEWLCSSGISVADLARAAWDDTQIHLVPGALLPVDRA
jgi:2-amino-4-hydroxy-6-hydroxymethyldihydropteridine diphosphokinase